MEQRFAASMAARDSTSAFIDGAHGRAADDCGNFPGVSISRAVPAAVKENPPMRQILAFVAILTFAAAPAFAGIADTPLPVLVPGAKTIHLYSVLGVVSGSPLSSSTTYFSCTSTAKSKIRAGVEIFIPTTGDLFVGAQADVLPGATVTFASQSGGPLGGILVVVGQGGGGVSVPVTSARIVATSKSLACTAFVADGFSFGLYPLTVIAKTKQKAAN
jgi:hypothetical protein